MSRTQRRLDHARETLPSALQACGELRRLILDDAAQAVLLGALSEIEERLYSVEGEVGCAAPATLFDLA